MNFISTVALCTGGWMTLNGVLHDIFILASDRGKKYDRDLLRLLMDGHVLITCGALQMLAATGLRNGESWAYYVTGICCLSLLVYCLMIFPFLKSFLTMAFNLFLLIALFVQCKML